MNIKDIKVGDIVAFNPAVRLLPNWNVFNNGDSIERKFTINYGAFAKHDMDCVVVEVEPEQYIRIVSPHLSTNVVLTTKQNSNFTPLFGTACSQIDLIIKKNIDLCKEPWYIKLPSTDPAYIEVAIEWVSSHDPEFKFLKQTRFDNDICVITNMTMYEEESSSTLLTAREGREKTILITTNNNIIDLIYQRESTRINLDFMLTVDSNNIRYTPVNQKNNHSAYGLVEKINALKNQLTTLTDQLKEEILNGS